MLITLSLALAVTTPADRSYILMTTERPTSEVAACVSADWAHQGASNITPTDYGKRVDYFYKNLGGTMRDPSLTLEVHDGDQRTLVMYGFKTWRAAIKNVWKHLAKECFPEMGSPQVVKPAK